MDEPLWKNVNFSPVSTSCFCRLERRFFVLEYRKTPFSWPILPKKKKNVEKRPIFDQNHGPLEKCQVFDFFNFLML